jgi:hypothetical protein
MQECWQCVWTEKHMTAPDAIVVTMPPVPDGAVVRKEDLNQGTDAEAEEALHLDAPASIVPGAAGRFDEAPRATDHLSSVDFASTHSGFDNVPTYPFFS